VVPDIITLSKALTGGTMALSAAIARSHIFEAFLTDDPAHALMHGPTYMANPLACAAALASLDLFEREPRLAQVARIERQLADGLAACRDFPAVADMRVRGAIGVVQLAGRPDLQAIKAAFVEQGVWVRPFRDIVYLTPAFTALPEEIDRLTAAVACIARKVQLTPS
jgi:adenosylmethionine-8-amino-7-oxononanoate aminotransferase